MKVLHLVDIHSCITAGMHNKHCNLFGDVISTPDGYKMQCVPAGCLYQVFTCIAPYLQDDIIFCFDSIPSIKHKVCNAYAPNRTVSPDSGLNTEIISAVASDCNIPCITLEGYETADVIYSLVQKYVPQYDHIYIHTADTYMYINVCETVSILPSSSGAKQVTLNNYERAANSSAITPYNTVLIQKLLDIKQHKGVPSQPIHIKVDILNNICTQEHCRFLGDKDYARDLISDYATDALPAFDLIYPLTAVVPDIHFTKNTDRINEYAALMRHKRFLPVDAPDDLVQSLIDKGLYYV
jgi:hypothetical protein